MKTESALTAKAIKNELKKTYPLIKFTVKSDNFSGGNAVRISYIDGVTIEEIEKITDKYQYGSFDSMTDCYESNNIIDGLPQVKYITINREMSDDARNAIAERLKNTIEEFNLDGWMENFRCYGSNLIYREFCNISYKSVSLPAKC